MESTTTFRRVAHYLLAIPALLGIFLTLFYFSQGSNPAISERTTIALAIDAWTAAVEVAPVAMPAEWAADEDPEAESIEDLDAGTRERWGRTNAYILSNALFVLLGALGISLSTSAGTLMEPRSFPLLRLGAILFVCMVAWVLWGFNLAFPGDSTGILPRFFFGLPEADPISYGMGGMNGWTDCLFTTTYAIFCGALVMSFTAGNVTAKSLVMIAVPFVTIFFPFVLSWKWGGGWVDQLYNNFDFGGSALVHWHVGVVALVAGGLLTLFRKEVPSRDSTDERKRSSALVAGGGLFYFLGLIGMTTGSTLDSSPELVAAVLQATVVAALVAAICSLIWWVCLRNRSFLEMFFVGLIAGSVSVSGAPDSMDWSRVLSVGATTGVLVPGILAAMDRIRWVDPLAVGPVHGLGGLIGTVSAAGGLFDESTEVTFLGQLILLVVVPVGAILLTLAVLLLFGATGFLFRGEPIPAQGLESRTSPRPPSLPK